MSAWRRKTLYRHWPSCALRRRRQGSAQFWPIRYRECRIFVPPTCRRLRHSRRVASCVPAFSSADTLALRRCARTRRRASSPYHFAAMRRLRLDRALPPPYSSDCRISRLGYRRKPGNTFYVITLPMRFLDYAAPRARCFEIGHTMGATCVTATFTTMPAARSRRFRHYRRRAPPRCAQPITSRADEFRRMRMIKPRDKCAYFAEMPLGIYYDAAAAALIRLDAAARKPTFTRHLFRHYKSFRLVI